MDCKCLRRHSVGDRSRNPQVTATLNAKTFSANRLKFTPDGKLVLISLLGNGDLVVYDAASRKEFKRVPIGHGAAGILMDPEGARAFIACSPDNYIAILDLKTFRSRATSMLAASRTGLHGRSGHRPGSLGLLEQQDSRKTPTPSGRRLNKLPRCSRLQ